LAEVHQFYINCAVYIYPDDEGANGGFPAGGTAFIIQMPLNIEGWSQDYVVTAAHVIEDDTVGTGPVLRINSGDRKFQLIRTRHESWFIEEKDDLAIMPLDIPREGLDYGAIPTEGFLTKDLIEQHKFGPGNEVFVVGRFVGQEGTTKNTPTVRFGSIALMPHEPFKRPPPKGVLEEALLVEFRSLGGYSGSPVFLCEIPFHLRSRAAGVRTWSFNPHLLGVDLGHLPDRKRVQKKTGTRLVDEEPPRYYEVNTAMSVVVPAWRLLSLLDREDVVQERAKQEIEIRNRGPVRP
jgi:hypothetical protein